MAQTPAPPHVAANELVASSWGNKVVDIIGPVDTLALGSGNGSVANRLFDHEGKISTNINNIATVTNTANAANGKADATAARLAGFQTRRGSVAVTTGGGVGTISFSSAFPSIPTVLISNGDDASVAALTIWSPSVVSAAGFQFTARRLTDSSLIDGAVRCNYIATIGEVPGA